MLRDKKPGTNYKIADKWNEELYEVISQRDDAPLFAIRQLGAKSQKEEELQVVHRNMIHPVRSVNREGEQDETVSQRVLALAKANVLMDTLFSV